MELAMEGFRFDDLKRWKIAHIELNILLSRVIGVFQ
ncbi:MAG: RagB/SusD family nutrient uptake outer membrane protein [Bacteroidota bacterium]